MIYKRSLSDSYWRMTMMLWGNNGPNFAIFGAHLVGFWHFSLGFSTAVSDYPTLHRSIRHPSPETPFQSVQLLIGVSKPIPETHCQTVRPQVGLSDPPSPETPVRCVRLCSKQTLSDSPTLCWIVRPWSYPKYSIWLTLCIWVFKMTPRVNISLVGMCDLGDSSERRVGLNFGT